MHTTNVYGNTPASHRRICPIVSVKQCPQRHQYHTTSHAYSSSTLAPNNATVLTFAQTIGFWTRFSRERSTNMAVCSKHWAHVNSLSLYIFFCWLDLGYERILHDIRCRCTDRGATTTTTNGVTHSTSTHALQSCGCENEWCVPFRCD